MDDLNTSNTSTIFLDIKFKLSVGSVLEIGHFVRVKWSLAIASKMRLYSFYLFTEQGKKKFRADGHGPFITYLLYKFNVVYFNMDL